jgi:hypothetical protein
MLSKKADAKFTDVSPLKLYGKYKRKKYEEGDF